MKIVLEKVDDEFYIDIIITDSDLERLEKNGIITNYSRHFEDVYHIGIIEEKAMSKNKSLIWEEE